MINKYKKLLKLCFKTYPELRNDDINIVHDNMVFCVDIGNNEIHIKDKINDQAFSNKLLKYIETKFKLDMNKIPIEIFAFFHEVGHIFHNYIFYYSFYEDCMDEYVNFNKDNSYDLDQFHYYRNIYYEYLSDVFAADMILNYEKEILDIINEDETY